MKAIAIVAVGLLGTLVGCASAPEAENTDETQDDLSAGRETFVVLRHDTRRCASPLCGGFWLKDANRRTAEAYVSGLDVSRLDALAQAQYENAEPKDLVLKGKLGPAGVSGVRAFLVTAAYRGLPGFSVDPGDGFATISYVPIRCIQAPCNQFTATRLNTGTKTSLTSVDTSALGSAALNDEWLRDRIQGHGAIVAARTVAGVVQPGGAERNYEVSQVFVKLPDVRQPCATGAADTCPAGKMAGYDVDENSCHVLAGCFTPRACPRFFRMCGEGYQEVTRYTPYEGCPALVCEPDFLARCAGPIPMCAAPPPNCNYQGGGCVAGRYTCGRLVCDGTPFP
jgi:hypothetical protein